MENQLDVEIRKTKKIKMNDIAKYSLELKNKDEDYTRYHIVGLQKAYYKYDWDKGKLEDFGGAAGLIRSEKYKGYCILCMTYHSYESDELPKPAYMVEFSPLYNELGQMILIEYDRDVLFCSVDRGGYPENWDNPKLVDATITFWNNGTFEEFIK